MIFLALSIGIVVVSWFFGAKNIEKKTEELAARKEELQQEYDERVGVLQKKDEYLQATKDYNDAYMMMLSRYPAEVNQVRQIMFVTGIEQQFDTQVVSVSYTDPAELYQFQTTEFKNQDPFSLVMTSLEIKMEIPYKQWKGLMEYVFDRQDKSTVPKVEAEYVPETDMLDTTVTMYQYAVRGGDRTEEEPKITVPIGTDNIFRSGTALSYAGSKVEQIEAIKSDFDCYIMLYPPASDVNAKVIAGREDREKVISNKNEEEDLLIRAEEKGGKYSLTYTLGKSGRPRVLYPERETLDIYVLSSPRMGSTDLSQVRVKVENLTDKKMRIAIDGEDDGRPRFLVESQSGNIEILK